LSFEDPLDYAPPMLQIFSIHYIEENRPPNDPTPKIPLLHLQVHVVQIKCFIIVSSRFDRGSCIPFTASTLYNFCSHILILTQKHLKLGSSLSVKEVRVNPYAYPISMAYKTAQTLNNHFPHIRSNVDVGSSWFRASTFTYCQHFVATRQE
jgi:hypothetical protein